MLLVLHHLGSLCAKFGFFTPCSLWIAILVFFYITVPCCFHSQCGQGVQRVEGSGVHGGDLVVVEGEETDRTQPNEAAVTHTADAITPEHTLYTQTHTRKHKHVNTGGNE